MSRNLYVALLLSFLATSCSSSVEETIDDEQPIKELSVAEETNIWIYNHMNHYYLWREDLPDSLDCDFMLTPTEFFQTLLSDKDRFSYVDFSSSRSLPISEAGMDYGFAYQRLRDDAGREYLYVLYVYSQEAKQKGVSRGSLLSARNWGNAVVTFDVLDPTKSHFPILHTITLESMALSRSVAINETVYMDSVYIVENKIVGYLCYLEFNQARDFYGSMTKFAEAGVDELVLDLRYNPGGYEVTCKTLCNAIVKSSAYEDIFVQHSYNDIVAAENLLRYGDERTYDYFAHPQENEGNVWGETCAPLNLDRLYVLTSHSSASCSELTIISLRAYMDVVVIGENSAGKGVGMQVVAVPNFDYELAPETFHFYNALGETVPETGIVPDYYIPDGYFTKKKELGDVEEPLLRCALELVKEECLPEEPSWQDTTSQTDDIPLIPVGEPSFVLKYKQKHYGYEN